MAACSSSLAPSGTALGSGLTGPSRWWYAFETASRAAVISSLMDFEDLSLAARMSSSVSAVSSGTGTAASSARTVVGPNTKASRAVSTRRVSGARGGMDSSDGMGSRLGSASW